MSRVVLLAAALAFGVGCSAALIPTPTTSRPTRINVSLTDALRIEPASISVPANVPVTFVVTNSGATDHEFYVGDEAVQSAHEAEMQSMGGMMHDEPNGIAVEPGQTKELTMTFDEPGQTLAGCHVAGHYGGGMRATISVT
jgi:uncharacterized cupredoxin-like copper-binding protein